MDLDQILTSHPVSDAVIETSRYFDSLCSAIIRITENENSAFFADEVLVDIALSARKTALLDDFETKAEELFMILKSQAPLNVALQRYFIQRLEGLQDVLRVNTSLQLHAIQNVHAHFDDPSYVERSDSCH